MAGIMAPVWPREALASLTQSEISQSFNEGRHGKGTDRILNAAGLANAMVQRAIFRDHPLRHRSNVRRRDANEIEDKDDVFLGQANQRGSKCLSDKG